MVYWEGWKGACVGVIDAIAEGHFTVARRPYLLLPPVGLDLLFWFVDRVSAASLAELLLRLPPRFLALGGVEATRLAGLRDEDLLSLLSVGMTSLLPALEPGDVARPWGQGTFDPGHPAFVILGAALCGALGLLWLALYLSGLAGALRDDAAAPRALARGVARTWLRLVGLVGVVTGAVALLGLPFLVLAAALGLAGINPAPLAPVLLVPFAILYAHLALAPEAITFDRVGPLEGMRRSMLVARRDFGAVLRLLAVSSVILFGFPYGWRLLTPNPAGVPLAIVGNAFIVTGLATAAMLFYQDRAATLTAGENKG